MGDLGKNSFQGKLVMLDNATPHVAVVVQAIRDGKVVATTLSDELGRYEFLNLELGHYQVRCQVMGGYVYYRPVTDSKGLNEPLLLAVGYSTLKDIDFRFAPFKKGTWRHYTSLDGLVHNTANNIYVDPDGFLWLGTDSGNISRFDGKNFLNFGTESGLPYDSAVFAIHVDNDGVMWLGEILKGVYSCDGMGIGNFPHFTKFGEGVEGLANASFIIAINSDSSGTIWIGTFDGGLHRYDGEKFDIFTTEDGLAGDIISIIHQAPDGMMWFGTENGFSRYDGEKFDSFTFEDAIVEHHNAFTNLTNNHTMPIHCNSYGELWCAPRASRAEARSTGGFGVFGYDGKRYTHLTTRNGLPFNRLVSIQDTPDGATWFGMWGGGMSRYDEKNNSPYLVNFTVQDGLLSNTVKQLYADPDGVIWIASGSRTEYFKRGGLSRYDPQTFVSFTTKDGLPGNSITALHRSADGAFWIGTANGVSRYDGRGQALKKLEQRGVGDFPHMGDSPHFTNFTTKDGLASDFVTKINSDSSGIIWFGQGNLFVDSNGVSRYDSKKGKFLKPLTTQDGLASNRVFQLYIAPDGVVWFGTDKGLSRYDTKTEKFLEPLGKKEDGLIENAIISIQCDPDGVMWFLLLPSFNMMAPDVIRYDGEKIDRFSLQEGLNLQGRAFYRDKDSILWSGSRYGIYQYDGGEMISLTQKDGPAETFVHSMYPNIAEDGLIGIVPSGEIVWFGTDSKGVTFYDGFAWSSLDTQDGLAGNTVTAMIQDTDGSLWFGTHEGGLTRYRRTSSKPKAYITSVTTDKTYKDLSALPEFTVGTRVTIEYDAIDFKTIPEKRQYRVRIQAFGKSLSKKELDEDWHKPTKATSYDYIFPESGTYTFEVQAIDRDLNYSEPASLKLEAIPDPRNRKIIQLEAHIREQELAELERVHKELEDARQIQLSLLPEKPPEIEGFQIAGTSIPAREVGGDFYDYLSLGKNLGIVLGDVTGKSVRAAMVAAMANGMLYSEIKGREDLWDSSSRILKELNASLQSHLVRGMNTAMSLGLIQPEQKRLIFSNAGMPYPVVKRDNKAWELEVNGFPLGITGMAEYENLSLEFEEGDFLVFCSDGIIEAENQEEDMYESERLLEVVQQADPNLSAQGMVDLILGDVIEYVGDKEASDDITIIVIRCEK